LSRSGNRWLAFTTTAAGRSKVDQEISNRQLGSLARQRHNREANSPQIPKPRLPRINGAGYEPKTFDLRSELYIESSESISPMCLVSAAITAPNHPMRDRHKMCPAFRNASAFASWLGLCPENKISCWQSALYQDGRRVRSRVCHCATHGGQTRCIMQKIISVSSFRRITRKTRQPQANHRHGSHKLRSDCLPSLLMPLGKLITRVFFSPLRRRSP